MSIYFALAGIALVLFYIGFGVGFTPGDEDDANLSGFGSVLVGGIACAILWGASVEGIRAAGAGAMVFIIMAVFGALFLFGLGRVLGSVVLIFFDEGPSRRAAVVLAMGVPAAFIGWTLYGVTAAEAALQAKNAAARDMLQSATYEAQLGAHQITFPGAPALSLVHPCGTRPSRCTTHLWISPGWNNRADGPLELFAFEIVTHSDVLAEQAQWCARHDRPDTMLWCALTQADAIQFRRAEDMRGAEADREIRCAPIHTGQVGCALTHDVAQGVVARLTTLAGSDAAARAAILERRNRADAIWSEITP